MSISHATAFAPTAPQPVLLARKRSWTEMNHVRSHTDAAPLASTSTILKKNKRTLGSAMDCVPGMNCCMLCDGHLDGCAACGVPSCELSDGAERFLAENPFDELPHPVLMRQHAVRDASDCIHSLVDMEMTHADNHDDDFIMGEDLLSTSLPMRKPTQRWNQSIVGASLTHVGRQKRSTFEQRRM